MYKIIFICLFLFGCGTKIPDFPAVWQCQYNGEPRAFYCINVKTKEKIKLSASSARMKAAQCLSADDYRASEQWVEQVKLLAEKRCQ